MTAATRVPAEPSRLSDFVQIDINPINDAPVARPDGVYLQFDGNDFIQIADDPSLQMTNHVTMEAWINPSVGGTGSQLIINKEGEYELGIIADTGEIKFAIAEVGTPDHWDWHNTGYLVTSGEWTHIAVTYDGDVGEAKTYINGELVDTFVQSGAIGDVYTGFNDLTIGGRGNDADERFDGKIDEVRVWNTTRTEVDIQTNMNSLLPAAESGLAGNWRLDEATGTTAYDNSTNNNHGTLGGIVGVPEVPTYGGYYTNEDTLLVVPAASGLLANDSDAEGSPLTISNVDTTGMLGTLVLDTGDGSFTYDPRTVFDYLDAGERLTETFTYTVNDGALDSTAATVSITVVGVEDAPVLNPIGNQTIAEGTELAFTATATDPDLPADILTFSLADGTGSIPTGATITAGGLFTWTPTEAQGPGTYTFDVVVSDGTITDSETITVTVTEANSAPILAAIGNQTIAEGTELTFTATATDTDLPANTLTFSLADGTGAVPTGAAITNGGLFTWTPTEAQGPGTYTFDVVVSDGTVTDSETITVTVTEANVAPVLAAIGNQTIAEGTELTFTATATDTDLPANTLTFSLADGTGSIPTGATITAGGLFYLDTDRSAGTRSLLL